MRTRFVYIATLLTIVGLSLSACGAPAATTAPVATSAPATAASEPTKAAPVAELSGNVAIDGSSTVYPITEAVAEEFGAVHPKVKVAVGIAGTGGGFKKFCNDETDISNASRAIKDSEKQACSDKKIEYTEFLIGLDGLTLVVNPKNTFAQCLTVAQLKKIWDTGSTVKSWKDVDPSFPDQPLTLYGPGTDSGTFDFFTEVINGKAKQSRADYTASEDDNVLVQGIAGDANALGYFGLAYYIENKDKLRAVQIDGGKGCVEPSFDTVNAGTYTPLSRPLFFYAKNSALSRPEVFEFAKFYIDNAPKVVDEVGYVAVPQARYDEDKAALAKFAK